MNIKKKILAISIGPVLVLGIISLAFSVTMVKNSMLDEVKDALKGTAAATLAAYDQNTGDYMETSNGDIWKGSYNISKSESLVDRIKSNSGMDVTFFYGDKRIMTSAVDGNGDRVLNSKAGDKIVEKVLKGGEEYFSRAVSIEGTLNYGYFMPVYQNGSTDEIIGMVFVGTDKQEKDMVINQIIWSLSAAVFAVMIVCMIVGMKFASSISKNIRTSINVFYYPPEISTKLIHFISTGNTPQVLEMFNLIHQENIEERTLPVNLLKYLLSDIRNTLLKARFELPQDADPEAVKVLDERFNEHLTFKLCEDLALSLCNLFGNKEDDNTLSSTIEKYIKDNYKDPSLGLNKISDEFQISESYFSHMFKEKTGVNFSTYLENIRMAEAARLIQETDISLNELYIAVGYNNSNTFRRAFKKVYGVTPSAMREK